jgi:hypothetical protein
VLWNVIDGGVIEIIDPPITKAAAIRSTTLSEVKALFRD